MHKFRHSHVHKCGTRNLKYLKSMDSLHRGKLAPLQKRLSMPVIYIF